MLVTVLPAVTGPYLPEGLRVIMRATNMPGDFLAAVQARVARISVSASATRRQGAGVVALAVLNPEACLREFRGSGSPAFRQTGHRSSPFPLRLLPPWLT